MNIHQLKPRAAGESLPAVTEQKGVERDGQFLSFKLVNKRARLRISKSPLDLAKLPGKGDLLAVAHTQGWFAAVTRQDEAQHLVCGPLAPLLESFEASSGDDGESTFTPKRILPLPPAAGPISFLAFASNNTKLLLALANGSILVYDAVTLLSEGSGDVPVLHTFPASAPGDIIGVFPNPGGSPELVGVLRRYAGLPGTQIAEVLDVNGMQLVGGWQSGDSPETVPTSMSWSPKGKQIALGLASGDIATFVPTDTSTFKSFIPRPPSATNQSIIDLTWISNTTYHVIFAPLGQYTPDMEQTHFIVTTNAKSASVTYTRMNAPYQPFPGLRPPGAFVAVLRDWDPAECLLVISDSTSSDIGVIASTRDTQNGTSGGEWQNLSLEESATPSLPLDANMEDTVLVGLQVDFSATKPYTHIGASGTTAELPPQPILYAYLSDGTLQAWHVVNSSGTKYPAAASPTLAPAPAMQATHSVAMTDGTVGSTLDTAMAQPSISATASATPAPATPMDSDMPKPAASGGFAAFANAGGASTFGGFGSSSAFGAPAAPVADLSLGGMCLGASNAQDSPTGPKTNPMFGTTAAGNGAFGSTSFGSSGSSAFGTPTPSAFGNGTSGFGASTTPSAFGSGTVKPSPFGSTSSTVSGGFGAFGSGAAKSAFSAAPAFGGSAKPDEKSSAFGQSGFGQSGGTGNSTFGSSGFGQTGFSASTSTPAFGSSGFGQSSFSKSTSSPQSAGFSAGSGFGAFASQGTAAFGSTTSTPSAPQTESPITGGFAGFASQTSTFGGTKQEPPKTPDGIKATTPGSAFASFAGPGLSAFVKTPETPGTSRSAKPPGLSSPGSDISDPLGKDSPEVSPAGSPTGTPPPPKSLPSAFSTSSSVSPGAFSSLTSTPNAFSAGSGFGAFGSAGSSTNKASSPFFAAASADKSKSAFGAGGFGTSSAFGAPKAGASPFGTTASPTASKSAFGAKSAFGSPGFDVKPGQSAFGTPSAFGSTTPKSAFPATTTPESSPITGGAFSAFSAGTSTFGVSTQEKKPFGDLLRSETVADDKDKPKLKSAFALHPAFPASTSKSASNANAASSSEQPEVPSNTSSFSDISGLSSSFEDVSREDGQDAPEDGDGDGTERGHEGGDDASSFLSDSFSEGSLTPPPEAEEEDAEEEEGSVEEGHEEEDSAEEEAEGDEDERSDEEESDEDAEEPAALATPKLPDAISKSKTQPDLPPPSPASAPTISRTATASPTTPPAEAKSRSSTTPPGTPAPEPPAKPAAPVRPLSTGPAKQSPFSLNLPSAKPIRSSPLASSPVIGGNAEQSEPEKQPSASVVPPTTKSGLTSGARPTLMPMSSTTTSQTAPPPSIFGNLKLPPPQSPFALPSPASSSLFSNTTPFPAPPSGSAKASPVVTPFAMPSPSIFGSLPSTPAAVPTPPPALFSNPNPPKMQTTSPAAPPAPKETGIQAACSELLASVDRELDDLRASVRQIHEQRNARKSTLGFGPVDPGSSQQLSVSMEEITRQAVMISNLTKDAVRLQTLQTTFRRSVDEIDRDMLKAITKKEEIARFNKAKTDKSFAKMLKSRTLPPEHLESQMQLRRDIRNIRDTIKKLEMHVESSKKKLAVVQDGKPTLKPSSLEMIYRTMNNVDAAIDQDKGDISALSRRIARLNLSQERQSSSRRGHSDSPLRQRETTPALSSVASTAAAALNAERSAQRLKQALLRARKEPLLNTTALDAPPAPSIDNMDRPARAAPAAASTGALTPDSSFDTSVEIKLPPADDDVFAPQAELQTPAQNSRRSGHTKHLKPVALKKSPSPTPAAAPPAFQWGPLPAMTAAPRTTLAFDLRASASAPSGK